MNTFFILSSIFPFADRLVHTMTFSISSTSHPSPRLLAFLQQKPSRLSSCLGQKFDVEVVSVQKKSELRDRGEVFKMSINSTLNVLGIYFQAMLQTNSGVQATVLSHLYKSSDS